MLREAKPPLLFTFFYELLSEKSRLLFRGKRRTKTAKIKVQKGKIRLGEFYILTNMYEKDIICVLSERFEPAKSW